MNTPIGIRRSDLNSRASPSRNFVLRNVSIIFAITTPGCLALQRKCA